LPVEDLVTPGDDRVADAVVLRQFACGVEVGEPVQGLQGAGPVVGQVEAVELLECVPSGFESRVGVEEQVEAGLFVAVGGVGSFEQQKPGPEQFGVEGGLDAGGLSVLQVTTHQRQGVGEPAHDMEPVQHVAGAAEMDLDGAAVGLRSVGDRVVIICSNNRLHVDSTSHIPGVPNNPLSFSAT